MDVFWIYITYLYALYEELINHKTKQYKQQLKQPFQFAEEAETTSSERHSHS